MTDASATTDVTGGGLNISTQIAGLTTLITALGGLSLTGIVGRVLRNAPGELTAALVLVLIGTALLALAGLRATGARTEVIFSVLGVEFALAGIVLAVWLAVHHAGTDERPAVVADISPDGRRVKGLVAVGGLRSSERVVLLVYGQRLSDGQQRALRRAEIGPDGDGSISHSFDAQIPGGRFRSVQVAAWATRGQPLKHRHDCQEVLCKAREEAPPTAGGVGIVRLPLPAPAVAPAVSASWDSAAPKLDRLKLHVTAENARPAQPVLLLVSGRRRGPCGKRWRRRALYRAVLDTNSEGTLDETVTLPVPTPFRRVCVGATFAKNSGRFPSPRCDGTLAKVKDGSESAVQLTLPQPGRPSA